MPLLLLILSFLAGLLVCNSIPHLVAGLMGQAFPSPFANPPGKGLSSPRVNFLWGCVNLFVGLIILPRMTLFSSLAPLHNSLFFSFALGFVLLGLFASGHFGKVRGTAP